MEFKKEDLIKSPLNYVGGKFKLLPQILPHFPDNIETFIDLFTGGCNVGVNVKANKVVCNDIQSNIIGLLNYFNQSVSDDILKKMDNIIDKYNLTRTDIYGYGHYGCNSSDGVAKINKDGYIKLRKDFNTLKTPILFYATIVFAFSNQIRFNSKGEFNMPVNKRDFNKNLQKNLVNFVNKLNSLNISFTNNDFSKLDINKLNSDDFVYCDPPYLVTCASYNESDGWNETKERELLSLLDNLNSRGIRFALSNVLENKGKSNDILKEWAKKYNINYLNHTYGNCNYQAKDKSNNSTVEVLITNY